MNNEKCKPRSLLGILFVSLLATAVALAARLPGSIDPIALRIAAILSLQVLLFGGALVANGVIEKQPVTALGFTGKNIGHQLLWAAALFAVLSVLFIGVPLILGFGDNMFPHKDALWFAVPYRLLFVGFAEETLFRGYMLNSMSRQMKSRLAPAIITSLLFGMLHLINGNIIQVAMTFVIGLFLTLPRVYAKNCSTLSVSLAHGAYDALLSVLAVALS
jgi:membrane protease YdiL (CAAX protease family)